MLEPKAICAECRHVVRDGDGYWSFLCGHPSQRKPLSRSPITGERGYASRNDLGGIYFDDKELPHCSKLNSDGNCNLFE